jgi:hypothetical protein
MTNNKIFYRVVPDTEQDINVDTYSDAERASIEVGGGCFVMKAVAHVGTPPTIKLKGR